MEKEKKKINHREVLTRRQEDFAYWFVKLGAAEPAAIKAGYTVTTASVNSGKMLRDPLIQNKIAYIREKLEPRIIATVDDRKKRLWEIAQSDDKQASIKAIDLMNRMEGDYAATKVEVDSRNININANIELKDVQDIRKNFEREI